LAQQQVNLTASPTSITLPDGSNVPMWGYNCGVPVSGCGCAGSMVPRGAHCSHGAKPHHQSDQ
jgi:hypothetical protein